MISSSSVGLATSLPSQSATSIMTPDRVTTNPSSAVAATM